MREGNRHRGPMVMARLMALIGLYIMPAGELLPLLRRPLVRQLECKSQQLYSDDQVSLPRPNRLRY